MKARFDTIAAMEIIEHIYDLDNFLKEVSDHLLNNGGFIVTTPNYISLDRKFAHFAGKDLFNADKGTAEQHIRLFTPQTLQNLLRRFGFEIMEIRTVNLIVPILGIRTKRAWRLWTAYNLLLPPQKQETE